VSETTHRLVYWTPRVLTIAFALFLALFAADVFEMPLGFWQKALALVMHLVPTLAVLAVLAIVWRHEWVGALLFPLLAVVHLVSKWGQLDWSGYAIIEAPLLVMGVLFLLAWRDRASRTIASH